MSLPWWENHELQTVFGSLAAPATLTGVKIIPNGFYILQCFRLTRIAEEVEYLLKTQKFYSVFTGTRLRNVRMYVKIKFLSMSLASPFINKFYSSLINEKIVDLFFRTKRNTRTGLYGEVTFPFSHSNMKHLPRWDRPRIWSMTNSRQVEPSSTPAGRELHGNTLYFILAE